MNWSWFKDFYWNLRLMNDEWDFNWGETEAQALNSKQILLFCNFISFNEDTWRILLPLPFIFMSLDRW
jgi:hypothetical protein